MRKRGHQFEIVLAKAMLLRPVDDHAAQYPVLRFERHGDQRLRPDQPQQALILRMHPRRIRLDVPDQQRFAFQEDGAFRRLGIRHWGLVRSGQRLNFGGHTHDAHIRRDAPDRIIKGDHRPVEVQISRKGLQDLLEEGFAVEGRAEE